MTTGESIPWCGGSIITKLHILSAAHCTDNKYAQEVEVLLGEHLTSDTVADRRSLKSIVPHPQYDATLSLYDFSILTLLTPIIFSPVASPICLPFNIQSDYSNQTATTTGWGDTTVEGEPSEVLKEVNVTVLSNDDCTKAYPANTIQK